MKNSTAPIKRVRPLRVESDTVVRFVTCRVIEERYWLHPILMCDLEPASRKARQACRALERHYNKRLATLVKRFNARQGPFQPELSFADAKHGHRSARFTYAVRHWW